MLRPRTRAVFPTLEVLKNLHKLSMPQFGLSKLEQFCAIYHSCFRTVNGHLHVISEEVISRSHCLLTDLGKDFRSVTSHLLKNFYVHLYLYEHGNLKQICTSHDSLITLSQILTKTSLVGFVWGSAAERAAALKESWSQFRKLLWLVSIL